jgi:hypothetical protein
MYFYLYILPKFTIQIHQFQYCSSYLHKHVNQHFHFNLLIIILSHFENLIIIFMIILIILYSDDVTHQEMLTFFIVLVWELIRIINL